MIYQGRKPLILILQTIPRYIYVFIYLYDISREEAPDTNPSNSHLKKLDTFTDKFVKKWTGLSPCATNAALHLKPGLDITSISTLYKTTMTQSYTRIRILGDS